jgi:hypothetical protein
MDIILSLERKKKKKFDTKKKVITVIENIERLFDELEKFHHVDKYHLDHQDEDPK